MSKWAGMLGFAETKETAPSVYEEVITERQYYGDALKNNRRINSPDKVNSDISVSNSISIVADPYAQNHFYSIRYATFCGAKWKVTDVTVEYPRLTLSLGELWNGQTA